MCGTVFLYTDSTLLHAPDDLHSPNWYILNTKFSAISTEPDEFCLFVCLMCDTVFLYADCTFVHALNDWYDPNWYMFYTKFPERG